MRKIPASMLAAAVTATVGIGEPNREPRLLHSLPASCLPRRLAVVDVTAGLDPDAEAAVPVQHHALRSDDDSRAGHVHRRRVLVERSGQAVELREERGHALALAFVDWNPLGHVLADALIEQAILQVRPAWSIPAHPLADVIHLIQYVEHWEES